MPLIPGTIAKGRLLRRPNRFRVEAQLTEIIHLDDALPPPTLTPANSSTPVFCPNPGRMHELMVPGFTVLAAHRPPGIAGNNPKRTTSWDLTAVWYNGCWVSTDTRLPNAIFVDALAANVIPAFGSSRLVRQEYTWGSSRFDALLENVDGAPHLVEVKSCTLVEDGLAMFPDAPTVRGAKHMRELQDALDHGYRCSVVIVIQRPDATLFRPHAERDPNFAEALREAIEAGVDLHVWGCETTERSVTLSYEVPFALE